MENISEVLQGISAALVTPVDDVGKLDDAGLDRLVERIVSGGVRAVCPVGSTGEGHRFTREQRLEVVDAVARRLPAGVPIVPVGVEVNVDARVAELAELAPDTAHRRDHRGVPGEDRHRARLGHPCRPRRRAGHTCCRCAHIRMHYLTSAGGARTLATDALRLAGVPEVPARRTAELLVLADVWGISSHGLMRLPYYPARLSDGGLNPEAKLRVVRDSSAVVAYHGDDGVGHWQAWHAAEEAARRAATHGVAVASVGSSSHCGSLGLYTLPGIRRGMITMAFSTGPAAMAPPGSAIPLLSTSPLAVGVPCQPKPAIVDLATSAVARGKIAAYAGRGETLPEGWAADASGKPTTDPQAALDGVLTPLGGGKGFALAFMVEALTAAAVGPELAVDIPDMFDPSTNAMLSDEVIVCRK